MTPDELGLAAWEALRAGRYAEVLELVAAMDTPALREERPRLVARALAWKAQAQSAENRWSEARVAVLSAIRLAREARDEDGLVALRAFHGRIAASLAALESAQLQEAADRALLETPPLLQGTAEERAALLLRQAGALLTAGRPEEATHCAQQALQCGGGIREQVLARLSLARSEPDATAAHLIAAFEAADAADDHTLITAVAQAARLARVQLPTPVFG